MPTDRLLRIQQFLEQSPDDPFLLFALAKEYEKRGDDARALSFYQRLVAEHPAYVGTYYHLGKLHERQSHADAARTAYEAGLQTARTAGDHHAFGELRGALDLLDYG